MEYSVYLPVRIEYEYVVEADSPEEAVRLMRSERAYLIDKTYIEDIVEGEIHVSDEDGNSFDVNEYDSRPDWLDIGGEA